MIDALSGYLLRLTAAAMLTALASAVTPKGGARRAAVFAGGLILILVALSPLIQLDYDQFAKYFSQLEMQADAAANGVTVTNREIVAMLITEKAETYILDKAAQLGAEVTVSVETDADGDWPYPVAVTIQGSVVETQKTALSAYIAAELAIPAERQEWICM